MGLRDFWCVAFAFLVLRTDKTLRSCLRKDDRVASKLRTHCSEHVTIFYRALQLVSSSCVLGGSFPNLAQEQRPEQVGGRLAH